MPGAEPRGRKLATGGMTGNQIGLSRDGRTVTVRVPVALRKRGGRKVMVVPDGAAAGLPTCPRRPDSALVKALARAFRWQRMIETGVHGTIAELAIAENINASFVSRLLRLTLLSPEVVDAALNGRSTAAMALASLLRSPPTDWQEQLSKALD